MDRDKLEQLLNLFDKCQSQGKPLEINIDKDLVKILPLSRALLVDILNDSPINAFAYLSNDQNTLFFQNNLSLCPFDQTPSGSCYSSTCTQLHLCPDYLFDRTCSRLQSTGKCSQSHSLATKHNQIILSKYDLHPHDENVLRLISRLVRLASSAPASSSTFFVQSLDKRPISDDMIDRWLGDHKDFLSNRKMINSFTVELTAEDDEVASMLKDVIQHSHSSTAFVKDRLTPETIVSNGFSNRKNPYLSNAPDDLDEEVQSTTQKTVPGSRPSFSNQLKSLDTSSKTSTNQPLPASFFGRGRGRQTANTVLPPPSFSRESSSSRDTTPKISFSHRLRSSSNHRLPTISSTSSPNSTPESTITSSPLEPSSRYTMPRIGQRQSKETTGGDQNNYSSDSTDRSRSEQSPSSNHQDVKSRANFVLRQDSTKNREQPSTTARTQTLVTYTYSKPFSGHHLCYLLGPARELIVEKDQCQIISCLPSSYCRVRTVEQGKAIEKQLYSIIPKSLHIDVMKIPDDLALLVCSSAAENLFQQNQTQFGIISEPTRLQIHVEVIGASTTERTPSPPQSSHNPSAASANSQASSDGKFHIAKTDSVINVISGDISEVPVEMMVCFSTSNNLRESVLRRAGPDIESHYKTPHDRNEALLTDGGFTAARKILFVSWQTEIEETDKTKIQTSLSDVVKWCIDQGKAKNVKSISFPPIGTGQLDLDPFLVCEALIGAASERLHQYQMEVKFVIYPSSGVEMDDECYQIFRLYLDNLCEQVSSNRASTPNMNSERKTSKTVDKKRRIVRRDVQSRRILTLSDTTNIDQHHQLLTRSLKDLLYEKTVDLTLVAQELLSDTDAMIDICLRYHVCPRIDFPGQELTLRGDRDSCFQCFYNLRQKGSVHQYSYVFTENGHKTDENKFNAYISLKIDEAMAVGETEMHIEDDEQLSFNIDLRKLQVRPKKTRQVAFLVKKPIDGSTIRVPSVWSSSSLIIRTQTIVQSTYKSLECVRVFEETMPDWQIERVDSIENYPLYLHFMQREKDRTHLYFHGCSYSSVQSIIHYGLHSTNASNYGEQFEDRSRGSICLTRDVLTSHLNGTRRSIDGNHYLFALEVVKKNNNDSFLLLSNEEACLGLPTHLIVYRRR